MVLQLRVLQFRVVQLRDVMDKPGCTKAATRPYRFPFNNQAFEASGRQTSGIFKKRKA